MTMKKFLMTLVAVICISITTQAQTVFISPSSDAVAYHKSKSCSYLSKSKDIKSVSTAEAKKMGRHECKRCYGTSAASTTKKVEKKATTTAKKVEKKATTEAKKSTPARDEKGRFIKKTDEKKATTTKKTTPARDEKGRFIKKADTEKSTTKKTKKAA